MIEKMVEMITPEMIAIVIVCLAALTLFNSFLVLITITSPRAKKRLVGLAEKCLKFEEKQVLVEQVRETAGNNVVHLVDVDNKIQFIENRIHALDEKIAENQNQLAGYKAKLKEYDTLLGQAGQMIGKEASGSKQAIQRLHALEGEFQNLKAFQHTYEQTRDQILKALNGTSVAMSPRNTPRPEEKDFEEEAFISTKPKKNDLEEIYKSQMQYHYP